MASTLQDVESRRIAAEIFKVCQDLYDTCIPDSILELIISLASLSVDTEILSWSDIQWLYECVVPDSHCMTDLLYCVSPDAHSGDDKTDANIRFQTYNSYKFHDCVDQKGPTVFILQCRYEGLDNEDIVIGGYCDQAWFSPYKQGHDAKHSNGGYYVKGSTDCKLFVLRNPRLSQRLQQLGGAGGQYTLPMLAKLNNTEKLDIMVAANADGPNFGFNQFYVTQAGTISAYDRSVSSDDTGRYFHSPVDEISFVSFMKYFENDDQVKSVSGSFKIVRMEIFAVIDG